MLTIPGSLVETFEIFLSTQAKLRHCAGKFRSGVAYHNRIYYGKPFTNFGALQVKPHTCRNRFFNRVKAEGVSELFLLTVDRFLMYSKLDSRPRKSCLFKVKMFGPNPQMRNLKFTVIQGYFDKPADKSAFEYIAPRKRSKCLSQLLST